MAKMRVKTDGLNLRQTPKIQPGNIIRSLPLAQEVEVLTAPSGQKFVEVETQLDGSRLQGFVHSDFLRPPVSSRKEALLEEAVRQWIRFNRGDGKETASPFFRFVGEFWQELGLDLDGRDADQPWSAAFISFVARQAGYADFKFSAAHARYILDARKKRQDNATSAPFWLFRLGEHKPQLGDLVCLRRQAGITFDHLPAEGFKSHCDLLVEVREKTVRALGGNVHNSVSLSTFSLTSDGFVKQEGRLFALMRNNR
jgi:hypothetical protein